ncbi:MAG: TRAP transporter small permease [Rhodospirillaceae bacterium]|nr:TRAP transporter small permease [Rhodospirillaceae bacterium]
MRSRLFGPLGAALDRVYVIGAWLAGLLLIGMLGLVLYNVLSRIFAFHAGGATDVAGYVMAASSFLALAYTFRSHGHIRVSLLLQHVSASLRRTMELWCLGAMSAITGYLAFYMARLAYDNWVWGERSQGVDATPLWIPQVPVTLGAIVFAVAVLHTFLEVAFSGTRPTFEAPADMAGSDPA